MKKNKNYLKRIRNGDIEARNEIIERNLRFVVNIARQFIKANETLPFPDLIQEGNLGLIEAVDNFDYTLGYRFNTYSAYWIKKVISLRE
ncbi:MAG: sigma-70 family RNA polymerase sigma factor [Clostridium sp.]|nr:MAG: sigma-70 family RNA polymerase sigma factor [Clostridium sp.]